MDSGIPERAVPFLRLGYAGDDSPLAQRTAVTIYRLLARGAPVTVEALAAALGVARPVLDGVLAAFPASGLERDGEAITAFWGLTLRPTRHRLVLGEQTLYTWCAYDTLFLPEIVGAEIVGTVAAVVSRCPASGEAIRLSLSPTGLLGVAPAATVLSYVRADAEAARRDIRSAVCRHFNFFRSAAAAADWLPPAHARQVVPVAEAHGYARLRNRMLFPSVFGAAGP